MTNITEISYKNFGKCIKMENESASIIITVDVGPRIISYSLNGKENILLEDVDRVFYENGKEFKEYFGEDKTWYIYGGHRLWSSPESFPHSYVPDNEPVQYSIHETDGQKNGVCLVSPATKTGQLHTTYIWFDEDGKGTSRVKMIHNITNVSGAIVTLAPWAMSVCSAGGVEIFPQNTKDNGLLSNRRNVFWPYSDINDPRFFLGNKYGTLKQVPGSEGKFKIGMNNEDGWAAYINHGQIFLKNFRMEIDGNYPDFGCNFETFTNGIFLECESLGELKTLKNGQTASISEEWELIPCDDAFDPRNEDSIDEFVKKYDLRYRDGRNNTVMTIMHHN